MLKAYSGTHRFVLTNLPAATEIGAQTGRRLAPRAVAVHRTANHPMNPSELRDRLFSRLAEPFTGEGLFDHLADAVYFIKNDAGQYVSANQTLVQRCGLSKKSEVVGRTAVELFPEPYGRSFLEQDMALIASGQPLINQLEVHLFSPAGPGWCLTTKLPLKDASGQTIGLVGISRDLKTLDRETSDVGSVAEVVQFIKTHLDAPLRVQELADKVQLSPWQLDQRLRSLFQLSTAQLILQLRMQAAALRLENSEDSIAKIALAVGYSDQSAFSRQFRITTGLTPGEFRRTHTQRS